MVAIWLTQLTLALITFALLPYFLGTVNGSKAILQADRSAG